MGLIEKFFKKDDDKSAGSADKEYDLRVATCAVMLEIANIDGNFSEAERKRIVSFLESNFGLSGEIASELIEKAGEKLESSIDLWGFTNRINENYKREEKIRLIEMIWEIVFTDDYMDKHEDYLMKKLGKLLRLSHQDIMEAKMKAKRKA
ncbi:MAG TPA: TerB family tellurite resistance protein [Nitrospirae bacterium]|nr:TerB family tellurite resistance protein [Nitrospirota bacterium]